VLIGFVHQLSSLILNSVISLDQVNWLVLESYKIAKTISILNKYLFVLVLFNAIFFKCFPALLLVTTEHHDFNLVNAWLQVFKRTVQEMTNQFWTSFPRIDNKGLVIGFHCFLLNFFFKIF